MLVTKKSFKCHYCKSVRYQKIVFAGSEFQFQCPICNSYHLFYENLFYNFQDDINFRSSKFVGTWNPEHNILVDKQGKEREYCSAGKRIIKYIEHMRPEDNESVRIVKISEKKKRGLFFIANAMHEHFNESFRAIVRIRDHILNRSGNETYNILIVPEQFDIFYEPSKKLEGVDELWIYKFHKFQKWAFMPDNENYIKGHSVFSNNVNFLIQNFNGLSETISKRPGPLKQGKEEIKKLLETEEQKLIDSEGNQLKGKYFAIVLYKGSNGRTGFNKKDDIEDAVNMIREKNEEPILLCFDNLVNRCPEIKEVKVPILFADLKQQIAFYKNYCKAVISNNGSNANFPALFDIPMFTLSTKHAYPWDFYCFARMISEYDEKKQPWKGEIEKADNIKEVKINSLKEHKISMYERFFDEWYKKYISK